MKQVTTKLTMKQVIMKENNKQSL